MVTLAEANRKAFDEHQLPEGTDFSKLIKAVEDAIAKYRTWASPRWADSKGGKVQSIRVLDYACGNGTASKMLVPFATEVIGIDVSTRMVEDYNRVAAELGVSDKMHAEVGDLGSETVDGRFEESRYYGFDIIVSSMALHHIENPTGLLRNLTKRLAPGGVVWIIDFYDPGNRGQDEHLMQEAVHMDVPIARLHFSEADVEQIYREAGLGKNYGILVIPEPLQMTLKGKHFEGFGFMSKGSVA